MSSARFYSAGYPVPVDTWLAQKRTELGRPLAIIFMGKANMALVLLLESININTLRYVVRCYDSHHLTWAYYPYDTQEHGLEGYQEQIRRLQHDGWVIMYGDYLLPADSRPQGPGQTISQNASAKTLCLLCGGQMVKQTGRYGEFYACSNWKYNNCVCTVNEEGRPSTKTLNAFMSKFGRRWAPPPPQAAGPPKPYDDDPEGLSAIGALELE